MKKDHSENLQTLMYKMKIYKYTQNIKKLEILLNYIQNHVTAIDIQIIYLVHYI